MNYQNIPFPNSTDDLINACKNVVTDIEKMFSKKSETSCYLSDFYRKGDKNRKFEETLKKEFGLSLGDVKGLYVFANEIDGEIKPYYVGISRNVIRRLGQHVFGKHKNHATLAYLKSKSQRTKDSSDIGDLEYFELHRENFQNDIAKSRLAIREISDDYELYMAEIFVACHFKCEWNSFKTH